MSKYIPFTDDEINAARSADIAALLSGQGERLKRSGSEYEWAGRHITVRDNKWFDQYGREGGTAIDFAMKFYSLPFAEAVSFLLGRGAPAQCAAGLQKNNRPPQGKKPFILPEANGNMRRVYAYLIKKRGIAPEVVSFFASSQKSVYEDAMHHNAVFVGRDGKGVPRHAHKKSTKADGSGSRWNACGSDPRHSFHYIGQSGRIYVFEAPVDMLSFITLMNNGGWKRHSYVSLCSVSPKALFHQLSQHTHINTPILCLDRDEAGMDAAASISGQLKDAGYADAGILLPVNKDWNDDLLAAGGMKEGTEGQAWTISQS
jgi:hypothetical protein